MPITDKQTATWARDLAATEDEIERLGAEAKEAQRELRQALKSQRARARHLLALISGKEGEQLELPAAEPEPSPNYTYSWAYEAKGEKATLIAFHLVKSVGEDKRGYSLFEALCGDKLGRGGRWISGSPDVQNDWNHVCLDCLEHETEPRAAEARADRDAWRESLCKVPGCEGEANQKGFCEEHMRSLSAAERKSILERNERLAAGS